MTITFNGNVGKDAIIRKVGEPEHQYSVCSVWVCENIRKRDGSKKPVWHKVTIWRGFADKLAPWLKTGRRILVEGNAEAEFYTDKSNQIRPYINVQATKIEFLDSRRDDDLPPEETETDEAPAAAPATTETPKDAPTVFTDTDDEDIPWTVTK